MNQQCMKKVTEEIIITEKGKTKNDVISSIFGILKNKIFEKINNPIVYMNTKEVYILELVEKKYKEKFLFFFMPREKTEYTITVKIIVDIKYIDI